MFPFEHRIARFGFLHAGKKDQNEQQKATIRAMKNQKEQRWATKSSKKLQRAIKSNKKQKRISELEKQNGQ